MTGTVETGCRATDRLVERAHLLYIRDPAARWILVSIERQRLCLCAGKEIETIYRVSTARAGAGNRRDSFQTPVGLHAIAEKIGHGAPPFAVFRGRKETGELADAPREEAQCDPDEDRITSRILWLEGLEEGGNRGGDVDTRSRFIYIHGTPQEPLIGKPVSHGCIRMKNDDVIDLFDRIAVGDRVVILA